jgi:8-oxo-dGTP diphosphatase
VAAELQRVALAVDVVCFALRAGALELLLVRRGAEPFSGMWALPGGVVGADEPLEAAAGRVLAERTGVWGAFLEQLYTFGDPGRDPRGRTVAVAYYALLPGEPPAPRTGRGVDAAAWYPVTDLPPLAFDHGQIAEYARWRLGQKVDYTPLVFHILPETFTLADLRRVYESIQGQPFDPSNFNRQMLARWDLAPVPGLRDRRTKRPARLYRYIGPPEIPGPPPAPQAHAGAPAPVAR